MVPMAGVDGCRGGWVVVTDGDAFLCSDFAAVLAALPENAVVAVDMPIGLLDEYVPGGRIADQEARSRLAGKKSSVFSAPDRRAFGAETLQEAQARGCHVTLQALNITKKIREVDLLMTPKLQSRVFEVHPEVCLRAINGGMPVLSKKKRRPGRDERRHLLEGVGIRIPERPRPYREVAEDDLLDACVALWSARRIADDRAERVPANPPTDSRDFRMEIMW